MDAYTQSTQIRADRYTDLSCNSFHKSEKKKKNVNIQYNERDTTYDIRAKPKKKTKKIWFVLHVQIILVERTNGASGFRFSEFIFFWAKIHCKFYHRHHRIHIHRFTFRFVCVSLMSSNAFWHTRKEKENPTAPSFRIIICVNKK